MKLSLPALREALAKHFSPQMDGAFGAALAIHMSRESEDRPEVSTAATNQPVRRDAALPMRLIFLLIALAFASPCAAAIGLAPVEIGPATQAAGVSPTLAVTTTAACPIGQGVWVMAAVSGGVFNVTSVADNAGNVAYTVEPAQAGASQKLAISGLWTNGSFNIGLPSGSIITVTFGSATPAQAVKVLCLPGLALIPLSQRDTAGNVTGTSASGTNPAITPLSGVQPSELEIVATVLTGPSTDTWTESAGYTSLTSLTQGTTLTLRVAYQIVNGLTPSAYSATNSVSRAWTTINQAARAGQCRMGAMGAGQC